MSATTSDFLDTIAEHAKTALTPLVEAIDREGYYPESYLRELGTLGGFSAALPAEYGGRGLGLAEQIQVTARAGRLCGATAFLVWCQSSCGWYLLNSPNPAVREKYLAPVARGELLSGTGMSNTVKHLAGIERIHLSARRTDDGYVVSGSLPWVSNVGTGHLVMVAAHIEEQGYAMFALPCNTPGVTLHACPEFSGLEGTQTLNVRFKDVRVPDDNVIAHPGQFAAYIRSIKPGFVLGQTGMGLGIIHASLKTLRESNVTHAHVNAFLDDGVEELTTDADRLEKTIARLAAQAQSPELPIIDVLRARLATSEQTLRAANSAVLHAGAKGYLLRHPAQRRLREAVFVAIVTPALKHLRKEIHDLSAQATRSEAA